MSVWFLHQLKDTLGVFLVRNKCCKMENFHSISSFNFFSRDLCSCEILNLTHCVHGVGSTRSPLPFSPSLKYTRVMLLPTQHFSAVPWIANAKIISQKQPRREQLATPRLASWAVFGPVAACSSVSAPSPGRQSPQPDSLLLVCCPTLPVRVARNLFF